MKKAVAKQIRKMAQNLPKMLMPRTRDKAMKAEDLIKVIETQGKEKGVPDEQIQERISQIDPEGYYKVPVQEMIPVNHENNLKKIYHQHGYPGLQGYCDEVIRTALRLTQSAQVNELGAQSGDLLPEVLDVPEGGSVPESSDLISESTDPLPETFDRTDSDRSDS